MNVIIRFVTIGFMSLLFAGCCDKSAQDYIIIDSIDVKAFDVNYFEDDLDEGFPDFYAIIRIDGITYFESTVSISQSLPATIDLEGLLFIGEEVNSTVEILLFDEDVSTVEDFVGSVTFIPSAFFLNGDRRETIHGGFLELDLLLKWECDS